MQQGSLFTMQCKAAPLSEWLEYRADREDWCSLCEKHATDGHLQSDAHMRKVWWYNTSRILPGAGAPMAPGNPDHFAWKADKQMFFCKLCFKHATDEHIASAMHKRRELYPACYMSDESSGFVPFVAPASPVVAVPQQQAAQQPSFPTEPRALQSVYQAVGGIGARSMSTKAVEMPAWQCIGEALFKNLNTQETVIKLPPGTPYFERF